MQRRTLLKLLGAMGMPLPAAVATARAAPPLSAAPLQELASCVKAVEEIKDAIIDMAVRELNGLGLGCSFSSAEVYTDKRAVWRCAVGRPVTELYANLTLREPGCEDWVAQLRLDTVAGSLSVVTWSPVFPEGLKQGRWERDGFDTFKLNRI